MYFIWKDIRDASATTFAHQSYQNRISSSFDKHPQTRYLRLRRKHPPIFHWHPKVPWKKRRKSNEIIKEKLKSDMRKCAFIFPRSAHMFQSRAKIYHPRNSIREERRTYLIEHQGVQTGLYPSWLFHGKAEKPGARLRDKSEVIWQCSVHFLPALTAAQFILYAEGLGPSGGRKVIFNTSDPPRVLSIERKVFGMCPILLCWGR